MISESETPALDGKETMPVLKYYESNFYALLMCLFNTPIIRNTVFANSGHLLNEAGTFIRPKNVAGKIYLSLVCCFVRMSALSFKNEDADSALKLDQFFDMTLFTEFGMEKLLQALIASMPLPVRQIFNPDLSFSFGGQSNNARKCFISVKPPKTAYASIFDSVVESGQMFSNLPKILLISVKRDTVNIDRIDVENIPCITNTRLSVDSKKYKLVAKVGQILHPTTNSLIATSQIKITNAKVIGVTYHMYEDGCPQYYFDNGFNSVDFDSTLLVYEQIDGEKEIPFSPVPESLYTLYKSFNSFYNLNEDGIDLPSFTRQSSIKLKDLLDYLNSPSFNAQDVEFLVETNNITRIMSDFVVPKLKSFDQDDLNMLLTMSSLRIELEGGLGYSFEQIVGNGGFSVVEIVLSVLASNNNIVKSIFLDERTASDQLLQNLALVLFQMLIGRRNISIQKLGDCIFNRLNKAQTSSSLVDLSIFQNHVSLILSILDPKYISLPTTKIIKYSGLNSDEIVYVRQKKMHAPIPSSLIIPPRYAAFDSAWFDLSIPNDPNRYRHVYSAPDSELFAIMIDRRSKQGDSGIASNRLDTVTVEMYGRTVKIHSLIAQHPETSEYMHIILEKDKSGMISFKPGKQNKTFPYRENVYKRLAENFSVVLFVQNVSEYQDSQELSIQMKQIPFPFISQIYADVFRQLRGQKRKISQVNA